MGAIPQTLLEALRAVTVVVGHYGAGKTNFSVNLAIDLAEAGNEVTLIDLDIVNPYFRASEQRKALEEHGVRLVAPVFAEAGTSLDVPSLRGAIEPAIESAGEGRFAILDVGGDDAGSAALGRYARTIAARPYAILYVANRFRNLVQDPGDALENLREIEAASHLEVSALVNNSHLKEATTEKTIELGDQYATELAKLTSLPLVCTAVNELLADVDGADVYRIKQHVVTPWEALHSLR